MESKFIGRDRQIKILNDFFNASTEYAGLVYGRRRIGKTELLKQKSYLLYMHYQSYKVEPNM